MLAVAYTAVFGSYDTLKYSVHEATCVTDKAQDATGWTWYELPHLSYSSKMSNRYCKFFPWKIFPWADASVYFDGNIELHASVQSLVERYLANNDIAVFKHPERDCVYAECNEVVRQHKADAVLVDCHKKWLRSKQYPKHAGLSACYVLIRKHSLRMRTLSEEWWAMLNKGPKRDQLYFDYLCDKLNIKPTIIPGDLFKGTSKEFKRSKHVRR